MSSNKNLTEAQSSFVCYGLLTLKTVILLISTYWFASCEGPSALVGLSAFALTFLLPTVSPFRSLWFDAWLTVSIACHVILGMNFDLYGALPYYDKAAHVIVTAGLVLLGLKLFEQYCLQRGLSVSRAAYCGIGLLLALSTGAAWEIFEFLVDQTGRFQAQRGLNDTMLDLIADLAGGGLAVTLAPFLKTRRPLREISQNSPAHFRASI